MPAFLIVLDVCMHSVCVCVCVHVRTFTSKNAACFFFLFYHSQAGLEFLCSWKCELVVWAELRMVYPVELFHGFQTKSRYANQSKFWKDEKKGRSLRFCSIVGPDPETCQGRKFWRPKNSRALLESAAVANLGEMLHNMWPLLWLECATLLSFKVIE